MSTTTIETLAILSFILGCLLAAVVGYLLGSTDPGTSENLSDEALTREKAERIVKLINEIDRNQSTRRAPSTVSYGNTRKHRRTL